MLNVSWDVRMCSHRAIICGSNVSQITSRSGLRDQTSFICFKCILSVFTLVLHLYMVQPYPDIIQILDTYEVTRCKQGQYVVTELYEKLKN